MKNNTNEEAYKIYCKMWEKRLAKGNRPVPSAPDTDKKTDSAA